jgi:hypothetical protein
MLSNNSRNILACLKVSGLSAAIMTASSAAFAIEVADTGNSKVITNFEAILGVFHSDKSYNLFGNVDDEAFTWQEGYAKFGLELVPDSFEDGRVYGKINYITTFTEGEGDPSGFTKGNETLTNLEELYLGYRQDGVMLGSSAWNLDLSTGRQVVQLGDGFIIASDALNFGSGIGSDFDRGGAYYLAGRRAFDRTFMARASNETWKAQAGWLQSDNKAQAETELALATLQHSHGTGLIEAAFIHGLDVNDDFATPVLAEREDMNTYSVRFEESLGIENFSLRGEFAHQSKSTDENSWYLEPAYTFADLPWQPSLTFRYSRFSEEWDPLFYGFTRGFGTWFQGEVAGNFAGPFNSNTEVLHLGASAQPLPNLTLGALAFDFSTLDTDFGDLGGQEFDLYAEWFPTQNFYIAPLIGLYQPDKSAAEGGLQLGDDDTNVYGQILFGAFF